MITKEQFSQNILPTTLFYEGGYVFDKNDAGGETYRGISRRANPNWAGWQYLEKWLPLHTGDIVNDQKLKQCVAETYWDKYFVANQFDKFNDLRVALCCFDFAVHGGYNGKRLQALLNTLGCNLKIDGIVGAKTIAAVNSVDGKTLSNAILDLRKKYLQDIIIARPINEKFSDGWYKRLGQLRKVVNA